MPMKLEQLGQYLMAAGQLAIQESYPIYAWCLENNIKRFADTPANEEKLTPLFRSYWGSAAGRYSYSRTSKSSSTARRILTIPQPIKDKHTFNAGYYPKARDFLLRWLDLQDTDYLKICDPYFGIEDLEVLELVLHVNPDCKVSVLTSKKQQLQSEPEKNVSLEEKFRKKWHQISEHNPPDTEIIIVSVENSGDISNS